MPVAGIANQVVRECLKKFTTAGSITLARKLYREHGRLWPNQEACYTMVRRLRGSQGKHSRQCTVAEKDERQYDAKRQFKLPPGRTEYEDWKPFQIDTAGRWLIMSDIHAPWHDAKAIGACVKEAKRRGIKGLLLNGDTLDAYAISRWQTDPRKRDFGEEVETHRDLLAYLKQEFPKARRIYKLGNHDERWDAYMQVKAAELLNLPEFAYEKVMGLETYGFEVVKDKRPMMMGGLAVLHGHEFGKSIFSPVMPSRGLFLRTVESALCSHYHRSSHYAETALSGKLISCWVTGCLCQMHPEYAAINKWNQGAAFNELGSDGSYRVDNLRYIDGKLW